MQIRQPPPSFESVKAVLQDTMSLQVSAQLLGRSRYWLIAYLHREKRVAWWVKEKKRWKRERNRLRVARYRRAAAIRAAARLRAWQGLPPDPPLGWSTAGDAPALTNGAGPGKGGPGAPPGGA